MTTLLVLYPTPTDPVAFEDHYRARHLPLVAALPGISHARFALGLDGDGGPVYGVFQAEFASPEALSAALGSPAGRAVQEDVPRYATGGATVLTFDAEDVPSAP